MKEVASKFQEKEQTPQDNASRGGLPEQEHQVPVARDLRFVVKESINLGLRMVTEIERMLNKIKD